MRSLIVYVTNAVWGCDDADPDDGEHPEEFDALVMVPDGFDFSDRLVVDDYIHTALIEQCDCCLIEGDFQWGEDLRHGY